MTIGFVVYLDAEEVAERLGINATSLMSQVKLGKFPKPVQATRGRSERGKNRTRAYWRKKDIDDYQDILLMQQEEAERYNDKLLADLRSNVARGIGNNEAPTGLRNEILRGSRGETRGAKVIPRLELLRDR